MKFRSISSLLIALLLLAACGGATSPTAAPGNTSGGNAGSGENFTVNVTGAVTTTLQSSNSTAATGSDGESGTTTFTFGNSTAKQSVSLVFWGIKPDAGTYEIHKLFELKEKKGVTGLFVDNSSTTRTFTAGSGNLTLEVKDGKYSGSFTFTATGGEIGGDMTQSVSVNGNFSNIN